MSQYLNPILIVSPPRSGSSLLSYILNESGVQVGICKPADEFNKYGYFENLRIRDYIIKYLKNCDTDNLGKKYQPVDLKEPYHNFNRKMYRFLRQENIKKDVPWLFKDPKIALCWNIFNELYPNAKWILLHRNKKEILSSFNRTKFMDAYDNEKDWLNYLNCWYSNMNSIEKECKNVFSINIESIFNNDTDIINNMFNFLEVKNQNKHTVCINKSFFTN